MYRDVRFDEIKDRRDSVLIDVRSEGEYAESHIPGAVNIPIFNNEERARVGTVYKQVGPERAKELGLRIASAKLPELVKAVEQAAGGKQPVVYCWRGGMRSKSVATVLDLMGLPVCRLEGGYRGYRESVKEKLARYRLDSKCVVIQGMTGVGKTQLLHLLTEDGEPVLDLERMAGHKGSAFGSIGEKPSNQRTFDSLLLQRLEELEGSPYIIIEAESKRIGRVNMPDFLITAKEQGLHILLEAPLHIRVKRTLDQYIVEDPEFNEKVKGALSAIEKKLSPDDREAVMHAAEQKRYEDLTELLLVKYYDPRYRYTMDQYVGEFTRVDATDLAACKESVKRVIREKLKLAKETALYPI
ncbi:tRNA 2-selenouridine(34) synthase MnmH [Effusibacillus lacus]|uniref:tRNA 2-selenouridine synthase n=1 Tax=Effusibacillus lacus TaxID=1348429 RepID=A0A292YPB9_9BACL|nr:tRNA 2-selenouridine(34) synthase MnmH [Effusibacillus lacus]TCS72294.1 tRNA 2-selenouridine synthase [Effusibacillus lacus]GAX90234.1 tRNA 2-selenouridine synthase [Effusibacillus lacus]